MKRAIAMSKSKSSIAPRPARDRRARMFASMPSVPEVLDEGLVMRLERRLGSRNSQSNCSPLAFVRLPSLTVQPASLSNSPAPAQQLAILPGPVGHRRAPMPARTLPAPCRGTAPAARFRPATAHRAPSCRNSGTPNACAHRNRT